MKLEVEKLHLEGDLMVIVNSLMQGMLVWNINKFIKSTCNLLNSFQSFKVSQSGNEVADTLSKWVVSFIEDINSDFWEKYNDLGWRESIDSTSPT